MNLYKKLKRKVLWKLEHIENDRYRKKFNIGENTLLRSRVRCPNPQQVTIGNNSFVNYEVFFMLQILKMRKQKLQ